MHQHAIPLVARREAFLIAAGHCALEQFVNGLVACRGVAFHRFPVCLGGLGAERHLQRLHPNAFVGLHGHDWNAKAFFKFLGSHGDAVLLGRVSLVDHHDHRQV